MARTVIDVRPARREDLPILTGLWVRAREESGATTDGPHGRGALDRLMSALERSDVRAVIARLDGEPMGYVITSENPFGLGTTPDLTIEHLYVSPAVRRSGVARTLLAAVLQYAERSGCEVIVSNVPSASRDANRFFARLGFSSIHVRRVVSTVALRRKLEPEVSQSRLQLLRRRRSLRERAVATH